MSENRQYNFGLIGAAGYIAPRHMKAIKDTGNNLIAALDKNDSVGVIDSYFPQADFFLETERFDRHLDKLRRTGDQKIDYVSICSPNYLHDSHIRLALRNDADAICEKPLVLNPWNVDALKEVQERNGKKIYNILQLRLHPAIVQLKEKIQNSELKDGKVDLDLTYITSRGRWYYMSWKGDQSKSGGVATNIGIHFFDMLTYVFGPVQENHVFLNNGIKASGYLELEKARVKWYLSLDFDDVPNEIKQKDIRTYRSIKMDGEEIEFSGGFTDLHTESYKNIISGNGFGIEEVRQSIEIAHYIRNADVILPKREYHPLLKSVKR
jgi:UDP-N-acetyl-2-amino-2-deoxyglucuronate dehydrogenase